MNKNMTSETDTVRSVVTPDLRCARPEGTQQRLIPALPPGPYVIEPEEIDRFYVRVQEDGTLFFKGSRERIEEFLRACEEIGFHLRVSHVAYCG